jgi:hypothetical protein
MSKKEAVSYARALLNRGYTRDAARSIMLSKGFTEKEISKVLMIATKPEKHINITTLVIIAVILMIILIPIIILTKTSTIEKQEQTSQQQIKKTPPETQKYQCTVSQECLSDETCINQNCVKIHCPPCQEVYKNECIDLSCDDNDSCTDDYCLDNICHNDEIISCNQQNTTQDQCITAYDCFDNDPSTTEKCESPSEGEPKECLFFPIACLNDDQVCPKNCTMLNDNDCFEVCGNNIKEGFETCDGSNCPITKEDCKDNNTCTTKSILGSASLCTAECIYTPIIICQSGDNCCPLLCTYSTDNDCEPNSTTLATGSFTEVQRITTGNVELKWFENDIHTITFDNAFSLLDTQTEPALKVYLAKQPKIITKSDLDKGNIEIGELQFISGQQEYEILTFITNIQDYQSIAIFHTTQNSAYAYAKLNYQ